MAILLDGKALAAKVKAQVREEAAGLARKPGLAVVLVGDDPASRVYVSGKERDCAECGLLSQEFHLPADTGEPELLELIRRLNADAGVDGILVQLPLPGKLDERMVIHAITPDKDVDCFHPFNVGQLVLGDPAFLPCTPAGVMELLRAYDIPIRGRHCVVLGRSNIVGKPMASLLLQSDGTVTTCHSRTEKLAEITRQADILISAVGRRKLVTADMVREGAAVVDVAMNRDENGKLCGDVDFGPVSEKASYITPVPGGVGPMTRAILMRNILTAARRHQDR